MIRLSIILFLFLSTRTLAQHDTGAHDFFDGLSDCAASLGGWKCLELDLSSEVVEESDSTKRYDYSWDFGDGVRQQGARIEHCYEKFGSYQVTMNLLDMRTNTVIRNELSATVHLYPEIYPAIKVNTDNQAPSFIGFSYDDRDSNLLPDQIFWRIDGSVYEGPAVVHAFPVAGVYLIEMGVVKDMGFLGTVTACATQEITIKDSDLWTREMRDILAHTRARAGTGPFAMDEIFCRITEVSQRGGAPAVIGLNALMTQVRLEEGKVYELLLFSGNMFTKKKQLNTRNISGNNLYVALKDSVTALFREPLAMLRALELGGTGGIADSVELKETAAVLIKHPQLKIQIGSYMHSGSRFSKGLETSIRSSAAIMEALVKLGISADRVSVASPENNQALVNTCSALPDCGWENSGLNGKVEFKITGCL